MLSIFIQSLYMNYSLPPKHCINYNLHKFILFRLRHLVCLRRSNLPGRSGEVPLNRHTLDLRFESMLLQYGFPPKLEENHISLCQRVFSKIIREGYITKYRIATKFFNLVNNIHIVVCTYSC